VTCGCDHGLAVHGSFGLYVEGPIPREARERLVMGFTYVGQ
jgi:hypothetical protein